MQPAFFPIIYIIAFIAVVLAIQGLAGLLFSGRERSRRVNRRLTLLQSGMKPDDVYAALVRRTPSARIQNKRLLDLYETLWTYCRQAGLTLTPMRLLLIVAAATGVLWLLSMALLKSSHGAGFAVDAVLRLIGAAILSVGGTWVWINGQRARRLKKLEEQLPLALDVVVRAIRAGHPVVSAVQLAADELGDPLGSEFGLIVDEYTYGSDFKDALVGFARRTGSPDAHFFAVSVGIQAETGGNLAEILDGLSSVIRARRTLGKKVTALASEGKASAYVLSGLPIFLVGSLMLMQPTYYTEKMGDPLFVLIATMVMVLYLVGWLFIRRIINFKY
jgi:tight adherence protein B